MEDKIKHAGNRHDRRATAAIYKAPGQTVRTSRPRHKFIAAKLAAQKAKDEALHVAFRTPRTPEELREAVRGITMAAIADAITERAGREA